MHRIHLACEEVRSDAQFNETMTLATNLVATFAPRFQPDQLNHRHLHQLVHPAQTIQHAEEVSNGEWLCDITEGDEGITTAGSVGFLVV